MSYFCKLLVIICTAVTLLVISSHAVFAAGTPANTLISNTATLVYDVNGVSQPNITSPAATFLVDNKVNLGVATSNSPTIVTPAQLKAVTTFTVTNFGNAVQDYALTGGNVAGAPTVFGLVDNFNALACSTFAETNGTAGYQAGADTATFIDELAADASQDVYIVCDIPAGQLSNDQAVTELTAVTRAGGTSGLGAVLTQTAGVDNPAAVDIVFADPDTLAANANGTIPRQIPRDATAFARDAYRVAAVTANVNKTATCSPTPSDCSQAKTGTVITYQIQVNVTGSGTANGLIVTDPLPSDITYVVGTLNVAPAAVSTSVTAGTATIDLGNVAVTPATPKTFIITLKASIN